MIFESRINMDILSLREYAHLNICRSIFVVRQTHKTCGGNARTRLGIRFELGSALKDSILPSFVLVLPLAGLMCLWKTMLSQ